jgi:hypothetical protein
LDLASVECVIVSLGCPLSVLEPPWHIAAAVIKKRGAPPEEERTAEAPRFSAVQVAVAGGLLGILPVKPRQIATCGIVMSCINLYLMAPSLPALAPKAKSG